MYSGKFLRLATSRPAIGAARLTPSRHDPIHMIASLDHYIQTAGPIGTSFIIMHDRTDFMMNHHARSLI